MEALGLLAIPVGLGSLICWVIVLIKMFKTDGVVPGIIGIICGLYALIWGWQHKDLVGNTLMLAAVTPRAVAPPVSSTSA